MNAEELIEQARRLSAPERLGVLRALAAMEPPPKVLIGSSMAEAELIRCFESLDRTMLSLPPSDPLTSGFYGWLCDALGTGQFPADITGDLAELLITVENFYLRLASLSLGRHVSDKSESLSQLWALQYDLAKVLAPILRDLRADLKTTLPRRASEFQ